MFWIPLIISLASAAVSGYGAYSQSKEAQAMAKYNAQVAKNRNEAQRNAILARNRIESDVDRHQMSSIEANLATAGIGADQGSPLLIKTAAFADMQADRNEMNRQAEIARVRGVSEEYAYLRQGQAAKRAGNISLLATGIGAAGSAMGAAKDWKDVDFGNEGGII